MSSSSVGVLDNGGGSAELLGPLIDVAGMSTCRVAVPFTVERASSKVGAFSGLAGYSLSVGSFAGDRDRALCRIGENSGCVKSICGMDCDAGAGKTGTERERSCEGVEGGRVVAIVEEGFMSCEASARWRASCSGVGRDEPASV